MNERRALQGVAQIVRFNRTAYLRATAAVTLAIAAAVAGPMSWRIAMWVAAATGAYWACASLAASYYVYDRFPLYEIGWLSRGLSRAPGRWLLLHAGLDEFSGALRAAYPGSAGCALDFYDPAEMTEPSIAAARRMAGAAAARVEWGRLPVRERSCDAVFLLFAAHELRRREARSTLLMEARRALAEGGEAAVVEHLRDWRNFAVFGPGFAHFFSEREWLRNARAAGLELRRSVAVTPFARLFVFGRRV